MAKARGRCLPMNFTMEDAACGIIKERARIGSSLADVDPMNINNKVRINLLLVSALTFLFHNNNNCLKIRISKDFIKHLTIKFCDKML